jgi:hypothetical protein
VKFGPPPAGHGYGAPELASADADADAAPDAANVTVSTAAAAARQDRTILGVFAITELPPRHVASLSRIKHFLTNLTN